MGDFLTQMQVLIQQISSPTLKNLLLSHFNLQAREQCDFFILNHPFQRSEQKAHTLPRKADSLTYKLILNMVFSFAPIEVCEEVADFLWAQNNVEFTNALSANKYSVTLKSGERVIQTLMHHAPPTTRLKLTARIKSLPEQEITTLLFGKNSADRYFSQFLDLINHQDDIASYQLLLALAKINKNERFKLFQTNPFPLKEYEAFIQFFQQQPSDDLALPMLKILNEYDGDELKKLINSTDGKPNLLHVIFENQSVKVVGELLKILSKLDKKSYKELLTTTNSDNQNALEIAFVRVKNPEIAITIAKELMNDKNLKTLLTHVSITQFSSPLHHASASGNFPLINFFVEQPDVELNHCTFFPASQSMQEIARQNNHLNIVALFDALPIYKFIHNQKKLTNSEYQQQLKITNDLIEKNPAVLIYRSINGKTLLHYAVATGNMPVTQLLLQKGAAADVTDFAEVNIIDEALKNNHTSLLQYLSSTLAKNSVSLFGQSLKRLKGSRKSYEVLQSVLQGVEKETSFKTILQQYIEQNNDASIFFITESARYLQETRDSQLLHATSIFFQTSLNLLSVSNNNLAHNATQVQLIVFIFSMDVDCFKQLLHLLALDETSRNQLGLLLLRALIQPAIFLQLTLVESHQYLNMLDSLSSNDHNLLNTLANFHFQHTKLTLIPPQILQRFSASLSYELLLSHCTNRPNATLLVLALDKLLKDKLSDKAIIKQLFDQLHNELILFNKTDSRVTDDELLLCLNLANDTTIKEFIENELNIMGEYSTLNQRLKQLFLNFKRQDTLLASSFLREKFLSFAQNSTHITTAKLTSVYSEILAITEHDETKKILESLSAFIEAQQIISLRFNSLLTTPSLDSKSLNFCHWLFSLHDRKNRISLASIIDKIDNIRTQVQNIAENNILPQELDLKQSLTLLIQDLDSFSTLFFNAHLTTSTTIWNDKLNEKCANLKRAFNNIRSRIFTACNEESELDTLISEDNISSLLYEIETQCKSIDEKASKHSFDNDNWLQKNPAFSSLHAILKNPATPDFFLQQQQNIKTALDKIAEQTQQVINPLSENIIKGLLFNHDSVNQFSYLLPWILSSTTPNFDSFFYQEFSSLVSRTNATNWSPVSTLINQQLALIHISAPIIIDLQVLLIDECVTQSQMIKTFYQTDERLLIQFKQLCQHANLQELQVLINYILAAKKHHTPLELLTTPNNMIEDANISTWMNQIKDKLALYSTRITSIKLIIDGINQDNTPITSRLQAIAKFVQENVASLAPEALLEIILSYKSALTNPGNSIDKRSIVVTFNELLRATKLDMAYDVINKIPVEMLNTIIEQCLLSLHCDNAIDAVACKQLLTLISQYHGESCKSLQLIKSHLGYQDLSVLGTQNLIVIAKQILAATNQTLSTYTYDGLWIQRLLTSPRFIAASNPAILQALLERYRLISLTLKQDEFEQLNRGLTAKMAFYKHYNDSLLQLDKQLLQQPMSRQKLLEKRQRLLNFRAEDSLRALLIELEEKSNEMKVEEPEIADMALEKLYSYYNNSLGSLRSDLLFQVANYMYDKATRDKGDIELEQNTLFSWLKKYLPHMNFEQKELARKSNVMLFNKEGKQIAFVSESNHVMAFVDDEQRPITQVADAHPGMQFYDENRRVIGTLTVNGQLKQDNIFQKNTSALLVAKVPIENLSKSPAALKLLFGDIFTENSLEKLYSNSEPSKYSWIEEQVHAYLSDFDKRVHQDNMEMIVKYQSVESLFSLLEKVEHKENAEQLFAAIMAHPGKRDALLSKKGQNSLFIFLTHHNSAQFFANFLTEHHDKPWFIQGFQSFADFATVNQQSKLLGDALLVLNEQTYTHKTLAEKTYDSVLSALIISERSTTIIWKNFLNASALTKIQKIDSTLADSLTKFFFKHHCLPLLNHLNKQSSWTDCYQYKMLLLILAKQNEKIFLQTELRYSEKSAWTPDELNSMCQFVKRHFYQQNTPDENGLIGKTLFANLIFRCANYGNLQLFYHSNKQFDPLMAEQTLERFYLDSTAAVYYLPQLLKDKVKELITTVIAHFTNQPPPNATILHELKDNQAIIDWKNISELTWELQEQAPSMPLISAFIINYTGPSLPLSKLIKDYCECTQVQKNPALIHHLSSIMDKLPNRDISACLFATLTDVITKNPEYLDKTLLRHMANYYCHQQIKHPVTPIQSALFLIKHFGQLKQYNVVKQCCKLLATAKLNDVETHKLIKQVKTEARVEKQLSKHLGKWYFSLLQFFKRYWNYGVSGVKKPSKSLIFCDEKTSYTSPFASPEIIKTPIIGGRTIASQLETHKKHIALKERYENFLEKEQAKSFEKSVQSGSNFSSKYNQTSFFTNSATTSEFGSHAPPIMAVR